jgi:AmmeMemoRadiSam system protein B
LFKRAVILIFLFLLFSCGRNEPVPLYHTWDSLKEREYGRPHPPPPEEIIPPDFFPWTGIVSHHLLAHDFIDSWFSRLAQMRDVRCFYILCPSHWGLSTQPYSLTNGSWVSGFGNVNSDKKKASRLAKSLKVDLDPKVFDVEHGASTLMPYIKKYFPEALTVVVAYEGEAPVNVPKSALLADSLKNAFDKKGKKENFLLISTDFSHHGNLEETRKKDVVSITYLRNPAGASWYNVGCDNAPGIFVLDRIGNNNLESFILYHTNSWEISGEWEHDVTSYFFAYFGDNIPINQKINAKLRESYDTDRLREILQSARESIFRVWNDGQTPDLPPLGTNEGLAVRLIVKGKDRGCLAWYKNSGDMNLFAAYCAAEALRDPRYEPLRPEEAKDAVLELLIFGEWEDMPKSTDFIPGSHNLWLADGLNNTILQASLAVQRHHSKKDFLEKICVKAGLDKNAWNDNKNLIWRRSPAVWITEPLVGYTPLP